MVVSASDAADIYGGRWFDICSAHLRSGCSQCTVHTMQRQACADGLCSSAVESLQLRLPMHSCTSAAQSALVESARAIKQGEDQENIAIHSGDNVSTVQLSNNASVATGRQYKVSRWIR